MREKLCEGWLILNKYAENDSNQFSTYSLHNWSHVKYRCQIITLYSSKMEQTKEKKIEWIDSGWKRNN